MTTTLSHPQLLTDDPAWPMPQPQPYPPVPRRLRVWRAGTGELVAVVTESEGTSVTNMAEDVVIALRGQHTGERVRVVEHYLAGVGIGGEHFDEVLLPEGVEGRGWRPMPADELAALTDLEAPAR